MISGAFTTAVRTLTLLRVSGNEVENQADSLVFFPVVGALIGGLVTLALWLVGGLLGWQLGAGVAGVIVLTWVTGGLHLDGFGDAMDGLYGGRTRERMLEIMKDTQLGAFGVIAVCLALLVKTISLSQLALVSQWRWVAVPFICSRMTHVLLAVILPYARNEGGTAQVIVQKAKVWHLIAALVLAGLGCMALTGWAGLLILMFSFLISFCLARWMNRIFGGVTGDLLGMSSELIECSLLFVLAAVLTSGNVPAWISYYQVLLNG